jgi:putative methyltransferase (TIGR04325 family)
MAQAILASRHLSKAIERKLRDAIFATPFVSDVFRHNWKFLSRVGACRGLYSSYGEAEKACAAFQHTGYNERLFCGPQIVGEPTLMRKRDYPILLWLAACLNERTQILNLGGNAGAEYFTYRQFIDFPLGLRWLVWELPCSVEFGKHLAHTLNAPGLSFTTRLEDGSGADIVLSCGASQYFEQDLATCLTRLRTRPSRLFINRTPLHEGETFFTVQSTFGSVVPYRIQNRQELVDSLIDLGYHLVDCWYEEREIVIPFHPTHTVRRFYGFYFASNDLDEPDWRADAVATALKVHEQITYPWAPTPVSGVAA